MSEENKKKLGEQLIRCILDDKLDKDVKLRKMDYIIKMGADIDARHEFGYSVLSLAKMMQNDEVIKFLEERGADKDFGFDRKKAEDFFKTASIEEINKVLKVLPDGYMLMCDVNLNNRGLEKLPDFSRLVVGGNFNCQYNELETLKGAPREVGELFICQYNQLTSLEGASSKVGGTFVCSFNNLTSLKGAPREVGGDFYCQCNQLKTLEGAPKEVKRSFNCYGNQLTTLRGAPSIVGGGFYCFDNQLISLEGSPSIVGGDFVCYDNPLKSYKGKPDKIGGKFVAPKIEQVNNINAGNSR